MHEFLIYHVAVKTLALQTIVVIVPLPPYTDKHTIYYYIIIHTMSMREKKIDTYKCDYVYTTIHADIQ